jgi:thiol-disulfide isomerase/thioredoxin
MTNVRNRLPALSRSGVMTLVVMVLIVALGIAYFIFRDQSLVQKHKNTPAAKALIVDSDSSFTDLNNNKTSLNSDFGKVIVVMSWASWCPQCGADLEALGNIAKDYQGKKVSVLAINRAEDKYSAERFLATLHVAPELRIILDPTDHYFLHSDGYAMPETIIFRPDGTEALHQHGDIQNDELRKAIDELLK